MSYTDGLSALQNSLPQLVRDEIERRIVSGELTAGEKLNEMDLAGKLGVSRGPIREAFRSLQEIGLLHSLKNRGVFVRQLSAEEAAEIQSVRSALEELAVKELATRGTAEQIERLSLVVRAMEGAVAEGDKDRYFALNLEFHQHLIEATGNRKLRETYERLVNELKLRRRAVMEDERNLQASLSEHQVILAAIAERDPARAVHAMAGHIRGSIRRGAAQ